MSLSNRSRAFLDAANSGNVFGLILSACSISKVTVGRRKWARRWHRGTITLQNGTKVYITTNGKAAKP